MSTSRALNIYLRGPRFIRRIVSRYERFEILSEGALRTAVAHALQAELRKIGGTAEQYRVTCETNLADSNVVPDILIWKNDKPRFWIEIKDTRTFKRASAESDWKKLQEFCPGYPSIKTGYFVYVARTGVKDFPIRRSRGTLRFWPIPIVLEQHIHLDFKAWSAEYARRAHYHSPKVLARAALAG